MKRRTKIAIGVGGLIVVAGVGACATLEPFPPAVDTPEMRAHGVASRFFATPVGRIHVAEAGERAAGAPRVLFVHGSPGTWEAWRPWMEDASLGGRARLLAVDRPGYGGSERGHAEPALARQVAALVAVLEAEPGPPAVVVGHSLGGPIAARLAMDRPDLVSGLLMIAPSIDPDLERHHWYNVAGATMMVQWFLPVDWIVSNRELWPLRAELRRMLPGWKDLRCRTIVIQGTADDLVPPANADFAERMAPKDRLEVRRFDKIGHFILWQRPELVRQAIEELLAGVPPTT